MGYTGIRGVKGSVGAYTMASSGEPNGRENGNWINMCLGGGNIKLDLTLVGAWALPFSEAARCFWSSLEHFSTSL